MKIAIVIFSALVLVVLSADDMDGINSPAPGSIRPGAPPLFPYSYSNPYDYYHRAKPYYYPSGPYPAFYHPYGAYGQYPINYDPSVGYHSGGSPTGFRDQEAQRYD